MMMIIIMIMMMIIIIIIIIMIIIMVMKKMKKSSATPRTRQMIFCSDGVILLASERIYLETRVLSYLAPVAIQLEFPDFLINGKQP